jgi:thiamine biosynthesis lipoprotein
MTSADKRKSHLQRWLFSLVLALCTGALLGCGGDRQPIQLSGSSMGTTWHVTVVPAAGTPDAADLQQGIEAELESVNHSMSTYQQDSEISRFNQSPTEQWFPVSPAFYAVLSAALDIGGKSEGAYDVTVGPLVNLWGFGPDGPVAGPPSAEAIRSVLQRVGQGHLELDTAQHRVLKHREVALDFSSIAKGYGVDRVATWLESQGQHRYLVEVGGEMRLAGPSPRGDAWRIAIERPESGDRAVEQAIRLTDVGVATSGDYRNFFEIDGQRFSHSIDPRRGYPVAHDLVSVTVVHPSCMIADGWATALVVLGYDRAMAVAQEQGLAVYFIRRQGEAFIDSHTPAFAPFLESANQVH